MEAMVMTRSETLKPDQITDVLLSAIQEKADVALSFTRLGKWYLHHAQIIRFDQESIFLQEKTGLEDLLGDQPVGICVNIGHFKYLFEATIHSVGDIGQHAQIQLNFPDKVEKMQRRSYERQSVPSSLKVKCLFWHRGYLDDSQDKPLEQYWQGRLLNLSAGGAQIAVDLDMKDSFSVGQLVGVQFTPMSYQRPLLLEAHVKYLMDQPDKGQFLVGVEFLGLEAGPEGREVLHRLVKVIDEYDKMNQKDNSGTLSA